MMTAEELQEKLEKRFFRFQWQVREQDFDVFEVNAWFDAPDGQIKATMDLQKDVIDDLWESGYIVNGVAECVAWALTDAERHGNDRVTAQMVLAVVPCLREIKRRWPRFDLALDDIVKVDSGGSNLVYLHGDTRSVMVFYSDEKKTLFVK